MDPTVEASLIGAAAALIGVGGTVIVAVTAARNTRRTNQATIDAALEAQFADRYSRALEQIGSDNLDVRIGGIYALEGIALNSPRNHPTAIEVLTAFVREHSRIPNDGTRPERRPFPDVQTALTVVGRRNKEHDIRALDLTGAYLTCVDLRGVDLRGGDLTGADLTEANLTEANLTEANLTGARLIRANLTRARLTDARLSSADLSSADLTGADLFGANLFRADLTGASLIRADLTRANLPGADLTGAEFLFANLTDATWPDGAGFPEGWLLDSNSGWLKRAPAAGPVD
jgi:uncharacterized protein YjbI with pentapeptide repeats